MKLTKSLLPVTLIILLVAACSSPPPILEDQYYRLDFATSDAGGKQLQWEGKVLVERPMAAGLRRSRYILYSDDPKHMKLQKYNYHLWEDTPPLLMQQALIKKLKASGLSQRVHARGVSDYQYRLITRINRFERLVDDQQAAASVELEVWLESRQQPGHTLFNQTYSDKITASDLSMIETAVAFSTAVNQIFDRMIADLSDQ